MLQRSDISQAVTSMGLHAVSEYINPNLHSLGVIILQNIGL